MATPETKINRSDLKFFPSERLTDNDDGGGMPLGTAISGEANELFNPIPGIVRDNGGFSMRLVYAGVQRVDDEPLFGSFVAITKPPSDETVSYLLSRATKFGELRHESLDRIEAYNVATIESRMLLLSTQSKNSRLVQAYQRKGEPLPVVGDVYCLRQEKAGYPKVEQYIQVTRVTSEDREFTMRGTQRDFTRTVIKMEISSALTADFVGSDYPDESYVDNPTKIRETAVADAAQYYGVKPLAAAIAKDTQTLQIPSLMEKLVPTNQIDVRLSDLNAAGQRQTLLDGSKTGADGIIRLTVAKSHSTGSTTSLYTGNAITPGSLVIDAAAGQIKDKGTSLMLGETAVGSVNQAAGEITINGTSFSGYITSLEFRPAGRELQVGDTASMPVTINNRSYIWSRNINPPPAPGSLLVSYRAQGRWYDLRDSGDGVLRGASAAHGSGSVNFVTGSVEISTGELADVGSSIIFTWGGRARYFNRADQTPSAKMTLMLSQPAAAASLSLTWNDGTAKTAVSDARGNITGDWTGKYNKDTRQILIDTGANFKHPVGALDIKAQYSTNNIQSLDVELSKRDSTTGKVSFKIDDFLRGTVQISYPLRTPFGYYIGGINDADNYLMRTTVTDDGQGNLVNADDRIVGTINYATGAGSFDPALTRKLSKPVYTYSTETVMVANGINTVIAQSKPVAVLSHYDYEDVTMTLPDNVTTQASYSAFMSNDGTAVTETLASGPIEIDLLPTYAEVVTPSSVNFNWAGKNYFDREGRLYTDLNPATGAATAVGNIDYQSGRATLDSWRWIDASPTVLKSLLTSLTGNPVDQVTFRTPSSPLRPDSLNVWATAVDGTRISAVANVQGVLKSAQIEGVVDVEYGVASVQFGEYVTAAGKELEPWYNADSVTTDGKIWQPKSVFAETITYNATSYSYLPIDSNVVKIDTVRLPQDGRIPIFRRGDTIIIGNRQTTDIGSAHTGGQTVTLPRTDVTRIAVIDADDQQVNAELWDYDLAAGTITWRTPLDLSNYKMPLKVMHAQEERNRIREADIDGTLSLIFANRRSYPIADTYVSSVLIGGDLQVRVSVPFTQKSWNNVWRDEPVGEQLLNRLNLKDYPMVLTDDGAIKERWMIRMTGTNQFELYGETLGFVMRGDTLTDLKPINPATGKPYFTLPKQAFGADAPWSTQDIIRFNTWGTLLPVLVLRATQPNPNPPQGTDGYTMCLYGDTTEMTV